MNAQSGTIEIDGRNTAEIGLDVLRQRLALVPQDSLLFKGTLRDNLCVLRFSIRRCRSLLLRR